MISVHYIYLLNRQICLIDPPGSTDKIGDSL